MGPPEVTALSRELCREHLDGLVALDAALRRELGGDYSHEDWGAEGFLRDLPGKWQLSLLGLEGAQVAGFWIASLKGEAAHTHRVGVAAAQRRRGLGARLYAAFEERAREAGAARLTVSLAAGNQAADAFYRRLGFARMAPQDVVRLLAARGGCAARLVDGFIEEPGGQRYLLMEKTLR